MSQSPDRGAPDACTAPPEHSDRGDGPSAKTVGFAASLGLLLVLATTSTALYTGYLLWTGDPGTDVLNSLPHGCAWVAIADDPAELRAAAKDVARWRVLPAGAHGALSAAAGRLLADLDGDGVDPDAGLGLCRYGRGVVLSVGLNPHAKDAIGALQDVAARRVGLDPRGWTPGASAAGFVEYALAGEAGEPAVAVLQAQRRAVFVWADPGADATELLATVVKATQAKSMREDVVMRSAIERVGGGALQLAFAPTSLKRIGERWLAGHVGAAFVRDHAEYAGVSVRRDADTRLTHLHLHVGAGQSGVTWLKAALDPLGKVAASAHLDKDATAGGVLRVNPDAIRRHAAWLLRHPAGRGFAAVANADAPDKALLALGALLTGHLVWQMGAGPTPWRLAAQIRPGQDAAVRALLAPAKADGWAHGAVARGWLVVAPGDPGAAAAAAQDFHASAGLGPNIAQDRARLLDENQGFYLSQGTSLPGLTAGTVQFEALWIHTGLVAHLTFPTPR